MLFVTHRFIILYPRPIICTYMYVSAFSFIVFGSPSHNSQFSHYQQCLQARIVFLGNMHAIIVLLLPHHISMARAHGSLRSDSDTGAVAMGAMALEPVISLDPCELADVRYILNILFAGSLGAGI